MQRRGKHIALFFIFWFSISINNISIADDENIFQITNITTKEGLSQNTVRCVMQDSKGFLWMGTLNGLNRYDGSEFVVLMPKYGEENTLSDNRIKSIRQDSTGLLWIQTNIDHINCYDPVIEKFITFTQSEEIYPNIYFAKNGDIWFWGNTTGCLQVIHKPQSLTSNFFGKELLGTTHVNFVYECSNGVIWIGTDNKLFTWYNQKLIERAKGLFFHSAIASGGIVYVFTQSNRVLLFDEKLRTLQKEIEFSQETGANLNSTCLLSPNKILITTKSEPYIFNLTTEKIQTAHPLFGGKSLVNAFTLFDNKKNIWVYNKSGSIWQFVRGIDKFKEYQMIPPSILSYIDMERYDVFLDSRNIIWISTYGNGLFAINEETGTTTHFSYTRNQMGGLSSNFLLSITEDASGEMWAGTEYAGVNKIIVSHNEKQAFYPEGDKTENEDRVIRTIYEDQDRNLWLGTKQGNIYIFDQYGNKIVKHEIIGGMPYALASDAMGDYWVGTKGNGLLFFKKNDLKHYQSITISDKSNVQCKNIYSICRDSDSRMWLGTFDFGLILADLQNGKISSRCFPHIDEIQPRVRTIIQDHRGIMWVGGNSGVVAFNPKELLTNDTLFYSFQFDSRNLNSISNNEVKCIFEDSKGRVWLGTSGGGINLVERKEDLASTTFNHLTIENGLINDIVQGIQEDNAGNIWITTENGISKYNPTTKQFLNFYFSNHWEGDLFCESAICKRQNGDLLLGSYDGMYTISPQEKTNQEHHLRVMLTGLKINGNDVTPGTVDSPLKKAFFETSNIKLHYNQNSFNLQFAILDYKNPSANSYMYILEGYEKEWNPVTRHNVAAYRNIPSGKYTFRVKGRNSLGFWTTEETTLEIRVIPPIWSSPQALAFYFILLIIIEIVVIKVLINFERLNSAVKIEQQLTDYKLRFFTNISHEFRTPLTIIQGTIGNMTRNPNLPPEIKKQIGFLEKSSFRLLRLINQLLEFRRLQSDKVPLLLEPTDVVPFLSDIVSTFDEIAEKKQINFQFTSNTDSFIVLIDRGILDKVAYNLLSNAFKFTPNAGHVVCALNIDADKQIFTLQVKDSGIGIPKEKQSLLFSQFGQINPSSGGTGIGLHLISGLIKEHKGDLKYEDSEWGGACFTASFPLSKETFSVKERVSISEEKNIVGLSDRITPSIEELVPIVPKDLQNYSVLIIEDDMDVTDFLVAELECYFQVDTAPNGRTGLEKGLKKQPDLIICDIMMPEMNGIEVTKALKSDFSTCHIPIILLTAYATLDHQLQGIEAGADSYITKPLNVNYLLIRIVKLIEHRKQLQQKFITEPGVIKLPETTINKDQEFLKKMHDQIKLQLGNPDYSMDDFSTSMGLGRTIFYQKVKALTGYTPNDYLRIIRMKHAAELLDTNTLKVAEVAYKVGFNNPFYFSKCFKSQFGVTPSEYMQRNTYKG